MKRFFLFCVCRTEKVQTWVSDSKSHKRQFIIFLYGLLSGTNINTDMSKDHFILTTDYKYNLFSSIFSFEAVEKTFNSMEKADLLHSYMVNMIIKQFDSSKDGNGFDDNEIFSDQVSRVKKVIESVRAQTGDAYDKKLENTIQAIEERYPNECKWIKELLKDKTGIVCSSFFIPQIVNAIIQEQDANRSGNVPHLIAINLNNFVGALGHSTESALTDTVNLWIEKNLEDELPEESAIEPLKELIKYTVQMSLIASGEFQKYTEQQESNNEKSQTGSPPEE